MKSLAVASLAALTLSGCTVEPGLVVNEHGPISAAPASELSSLGIFKSRYERLVEDQASSEKAFAVVEAGTQLEYQLCSSFFRSAGLQQQELLFSKELITFIATAATGVLGAARASPSAIAWIGLGGASAVTGANIYTRNYLFSEDNVEAVQDLTLRAVGAARDAALAEDRRDSYNYSSAISTVMDVQSVCEVQHIINLARDAIKNGNIIVSSHDSKSNTAANTLRDRLGIMTKGGAALTDDELIALYGVFSSSRPPATGSDRKIAAAALSALTPPPLLQNGDVNPAFKQASQVTNLLASFPADLVAQLQAAVEKNLSGAPGAPKPLAVPFRLSAPIGDALLPPLSRSGLPPGRISVRVRQFQ